MFTGLMTASDLGPILFMILYQYFYNGGSPPAEQRYQDYMLFIGLYYFIVHVAFNLLIHLSASTDVMGTHNETGEITPTETNRQKSEDTELIARSLITQN